MRNKWLIVATLLFVSYIPTQAFDVKITSNTNDLNINDYLTVTIEVTSDDSEKEDIKEISVKWIEKFNIVSKSQSQATSTNISVVDWKAETVSRSVNSINLILSPKEKWEFTLWPVIVTWQKETKETKSLDIKVEWKKNTNGSINEIQNIIDNGAQKHSSSEELPNKYTVYFLIFWILVFILLGAIILFYKHKEDITFEYKNKKGSDGEEIDEKKDDFENIEDIVYPDLDDIEFVKKIEKILYSKISKKYSIKKIETKSYEEILESLNDNLAEKKLIRDSIYKIQKLKYSNILISKAELLEMIRQI